MIVDAAPIGFGAQAWTSLIDRPPDRLAAGPLRLRTAERIVRDCGGALQVETQDTQSVHIQLRRVEES